ncbi:histidine phosphatase family protein [Streptomyces sp. NBC_01498]|uniref:histidine phosphatase family protein n=1 Tax=Streptomyces sp. NBC_01498 TaxID=2975870 RepID=UPI002E7B10EA|nr:histidine phosphatase family protein [Streptomyces sp. NBC_01498]WTL24079.1 histidine phosphatase family protein [Streptomyces sp. NBC_01498]
MSVRLVYETHATTTDNEAGLATGWRPGELSAAGRRQAAELGDRRRDDGIDVVYTSDLARAVDTARIAFAGTAVPLLQDVRLRECDYGHFTGRPLAELRPRRARHLMEPFLDGQSYRDVQRSTADFLRELSAERDGQRVLVVAHSANRWALASLLGGTPLREAIEEPPDWWRPGWEYELPAGWTP